MNYEFLLNFYNGIMEQIEPVKTISKDYYKCSDLPFLSANASDSIVHVGNIASSGIVQLDLSSWNFTLFTPKSFLLSYKADGFTGDIAFFLYDSRGYKYLCKLVDSVKGELVGNGVIDSTNGTSGDVASVKFTNAITSSTHTVWCRLVLYRIL